MCCYHTVKVQKEGAESGNILFFKIDFIAPELPMCSCYKDIFYILIFWWPCVRPLTTSQQDDEIPQDFTGGDLYRSKVWHKAPKNAIYDSLSYRIFRNFIVPLTSESRWGCVVLENHWAVTVTIGSSCRSSVRWEQTLPLRAPLLNPFQWWYQPRSTINA